MDTATEKAPLVGIIMGSKSDMPVMEGCTAELDALGVPYELVVASAHRNPAKVHEWPSLPPIAASRSLLPPRARRRISAAWSPHSRRCRSSAYP